MPEGLVWPPRKEDLERLYLVEKLSAAKIAKVCGLNYKSPKVGESTVLYQLKKNGIRRRDPAEHIRKVTEAMVDEWLTKYQAGESLKQIAGGKVDPVTVWNHLKARGSVLRDKVEAQIQAVTKYERRPFQGDEVERAYLMGLRYGDLNAVRHGRAIRVRVSTTHPAMAGLFESLFSPYAHVSWYPREAKLTGYEWTLECDLDASFQFLLSKPTMHELESLTRSQKIAFLAGLFDAEGSIVLHNKRNRYNPEASFTNTEEKLLEYVSRVIQSLGLCCKFSWNVQNEDRHGVIGYSRRGQITLWRFRDVQELLKTLPFRHQEKVTKALIVGQMVYRSDTSRNLETARAWNEMIVRIKAEKLAFIQRACKSIDSKDLDRTLSIRPCFPR